MPSTKKKLYFYLHTHWDREWYWAFERYRTQLMTVVRLVVDGLEKDLLPNFHLDGQACALEDFIQLEPLYESRIKALVRSKRLSIGPWYVLNDQMLVGGESMIRNLEYGIERARRFGKPMMVGYCPDTFGHSQDLPRILQGFGIDTAVVWRGVPELDQGPEFFWRSPDGSEVVANLLAKGYHHSFMHETEEDVDAKLDELLSTLLAWIEVKFDAPSALQHAKAGATRAAVSHLGVSQPAPPVRSGSSVEENEHGRHPQEEAASTESYGGGGRLGQLESRVYSKLLDGALVPVGGDHLKPPVDLTALFKKLKARLRELSKVRSKNGKGGEDLPAIDLESVLLSDYLALVRAATRQIATPVRTIEGELRENASALSHAAAYMLTGVLSTRLYLKRENRILEHRLARVSEPLAAIMALTGLTRYPKAEMENAWTYLLKNQPHDSICGCSVDDVHREMLPRYSSTHQVLDVVERRVREELLMPGLHEWSAPGRSAKRSKSAVATPPYVNAGLGRDKIDLADPDVPLAGIVVFNSSLESQSAPVKVSLGVPEVAGSVHKSAPFDRESAEFSRASAENYLKERLLDDDAFQIESVQRVTDLFGETGGPPLYKNLHRIDAWLWSPDVPPLAFRTIEFNATASSGNRASVVSAHEREISNGYFDVRVDDEGNLSVLSRNCSGDPKRYVLRHRIQDIGDGGDSYNFDPIVNDQPVQAKLKSVEVDRAGPLIGALKLIYEIDLPQSAVVDPHGRSFDGMEGGLDLVVLKRSDDSIKHEIHTHVILKRGVPIVFFQTVWLNLAADHRLEVVFDTGSSVSETWSENHMSLVERRVGSTTFELPVDKYMEAPLDTFPCQRFFIANNQAFFNLGLPEYSVSGSSVHITILRAISELSRRRLFTRGGGAGPYVAVPDANCIGENQVSYGWAPLAILDDTNHRAVAYRLAEMFEGPLWSTPITAPGREALEAAALHDGSLIEIDDSRIVCTAFYSRDGGETFLLRLLNTGMEPVEARLRLNARGMSAASVNLAGARNRKNELHPESDGQRQTASKDKSRSYPIKFGPNELRTVQIESS